MDQLVLLEKLKLVQKNLNQLLGNPKIEEKNIKQKGLYFFPKIFYLLSDKFIKKNKKDNEIKIYINQLNDLNIRTAVIKQEIKKLCDKLEVISKQTDYKFQENINICDLYLKDIIKYIEIFESIPKDKQDTDIYKQIHSDIASIIAETKDICKI